MAHDSTAPTATPAGPTLGGRSSFLPQWMRQSLEHLSMKTNMEEYGTSPPENESLFLHEGKLPTYSMATRKCIIVCNPCFPLCMSMVE